MFPLDTEGSPLVEKLTAGDTFAIGATDKGTLVVVTHRKKDQLLQHGEFDLNELTKEPIESVVCMHGSDSYACILAVQKETEDAINGEASAGHEDDNASDDGGGKPSAIDKPAGDGEDETGGEPASKKPRLFM